ncbi:uncharacterized protein LOC143285139 [Babylonia areolata]|uniref:uncharacterized protein LOC143285139 n=1 Tax=Babylonia areolata TaxID=304850 RepID=UPI003FD2E6D4
MFLLLLLAAHWGWLPPLQAEAKGCSDDPQGVYLCNPQDPALFDICIGEQRYTMKCPGGLHFNTATQVCDWPKNADCGHPRPAVPPPFNSVSQHLQQLQTQPLTVTSVDQRSEHYVLTGDSSGHNQIPEHVGKDGNPAVLHYSVSTHRRKFNDDSGKNRYGQMFRQSKNTVSENGETRTRNGSSVGRKRNQRQDPRQGTTQRRATRWRNPYSKSSFKRQRHREDTLTRKEQSGSKKRRKLHDGYDHSIVSRGHKNKLYNSGHQRYGNRGSHAQQNNINRQTTPSKSQGIKAPRYTGSGGRAGYRQSAISDSSSSRRPRPNTTRRRYRRPGLRGQDGSRHRSPNSHTSSTQRSGLNDHSRPRRPDNTVQQDQGQHRFQPVGTPGSKKTAKAWGRQGSRQSWVLAKRPASAAAAAARPAPRHRPQSGARPVSAAAAAHKRRKKPKKTGKCSAKTCQLPKCRCVGTDIPGGLPAEDTPQMIMLTFDDSVNTNNYHYFQRIFNDGNNNLRNPNGCPIKGTFFVSGDATQYQLVDKLHKQGHEIASHSLSHRSPTTYWAEAGYDGYVNEIEGMSGRLSEKSHIPRQDIRGMRVPFLQIGGDDQYQMLEDFGYTYDTSMVTGHLYRNEDPPVWPFTLDYPPDSKTCSLTPCPAQSYPGLWEVPLIRWYGSNRLACAMPDACTTEPGREGTFRFLTDNFRRHYGSNRSPLGIFLHASWFQRTAGSLEGLLDFLEMVTRKKDVWVVTVSQVIDWVQNPVPTKSTGSVSSWSCQ